MAEVEKPLAHFFEHKTGRDAGYYSQSSGTMDLVGSVLASALINDCEPVQTAVEHGIPPLTAASGLVALIEEGYLMKGTLELNITQPKTSTIIPE